MQNIEAKVEGSILTLTIDLSKNFGASKSGKTNIVASSHGNFEPQGHPNVRVGVNVFRYAGGK